MFVCNNSKSSTQENRCKLPFVTFVVADCVPVFFQPVQNEPAHFEVPCKSKPNETSKSKNSSKTKYLKVSCLNAQTVTKCSSVNHTYTATKKEADERVAKRLKDFDCHKSFISKLLKLRYGPKDLRRSQLLTIASECCKLDESLKVDRDAKRNKTVLLKWFEENSDRIIPLLDKIKLGS